MIGGFRLNMSYLTPELALYAWILAGSLNKAALLLKNTGFINPQKMKFPSPMGIMYRAKQSDQYAKYSSGQMTKAEMESIKRRFDALVSVELPKNQKQVELAKTRTTGTPLAG